MANNSRIKGITVEIGGDVSGLDKALKKVNSSINDTQAQLKDVNRLLKLDPSNTELLRQKHQLLSKSVQDTSNRLETLKKAEEQLKQAGVEKNSEQFMALQREIIETENRLNDLQDAASQSVVALAKIGATADKVSAGAQKVADATAGMSKAAATGLAVAGGLAVKIVDSYADYEQLVGGVETLFKGNADAVKKYAADAYKTAGLSANEYMETVTSFSASLIQSLGGNTEKAVKYADMAITDMSDNANKMGTDMQSIQNAYQGFAKQNYTMLDNLKLGYGGTREEMQRLLDDAGDLSGKVFDISNFSDIVMAINIIQNEMGIAGTTAKEAAGTVSGSVESFKSSVSNLAAGIGDANADIDQLVGNVVSSFETMASNIIPILKKIWDHLPGGAKFALSATAVVAAISPIAGGISRVGSAVSTLAPVISTLGTKIGTIGKAIASFAVNAGQSIASFAVSAGKWIASFAVNAAQGISSAFSAAASYIAANPIVLIIAAVVALVALIATKGDEIQAILQKVDDFLQGIFAKDWTEIFGPVLGNILNGFFANVKNIWDSIKSVFDGVIDFIRGVFTGDWSRAWEGVKEIFSGIFKALVSIAKAPLNGIISLLNGAISGLNRMIDGLNSIHFTIPDWVPLLGGKNFGLNLGHISSIPYLASGGILSKGSAIVGEAGPELLTMMGDRAVVQPLNSSTTTNHNLGGVSIVVYGAPGQDVDDLAEAIMYRMQSAVERREAVFA